jgi:hypothetical protein
MMLVALGLLCCVVAFVGGFIYGVAYGMELMREHARH